MDETRPTPPVGTVDLANIFFAGPCNQHCPYCIGKQLPASLRRCNLAEFPLRNLEPFAAQLEQHSVQQVTLTGTNTDPQLYQYEAQLIRWLRIRLPGVQLSLHTNGQRALERIDVFNTYDRATISFPSFDRRTFFQMTGTRRMPDLSAIVGASDIPIKVSCVLSHQNVAQADSFIAQCRALGIRRIAFRQQYGDHKRWRILPQLKPVRYHRNNPVYVVHGIEVTYWQFERTTVSALNLFPNGATNAEYLLSRAV
jgi:molybdenum cofactor biosynthesis enzyme MoaA